MLAHHFRRGQIRTKAFGHNLALLLRCPNPTSLAPRDHLDTLTATTLMTYLMSVLSVGQGRSGREWQGRFHDQTLSRPLYPPQCVTAVSLTADMAPSQGQSSSSGASCASRTCSRASNGSHLYASRRPTSTAGSGLSSRPAG